MHRIVQGLVHALRSVSAAVGLKVHQPRIHGVEIAGQIHDLRDIGITAVAVRDQAHPDLGRRLGGGHGRCDRPDLLLGRLDQAAHAARGVEHEHDLDLGPLVKHLADQRIRGLDLMP